MGIQNLSEDVLLITLPRQPQHGDELEVVSTMFGDSFDGDVVIDFSDVKMLTSEVISGLMMLDKLLRGAGRHLVLCSLPPIIKQVFVRTGLLTVFEFANSRTDALANLQSGNMSRTGI